MWTKTLDERGMSSSLMSLFAIALVAMAIIGGPVLIMKMAEFSHDRAEAARKKNKNDRT